MALPKLPSLAKVMEDPTILRGLPRPMIEAIKQRLLRVDQALGGITNVPATPVQMALQHPRYQWMDTRHLHYLGDEVAEAVRLNKEDGKSAARCVVMPPRHAKSTTCSQWLPFWYLAKYPEDNVLFMSYEADFAAKWGAKVRSLVELYGAEYNLHLNPKKVAGNDWELTTGGGMKTVGVGGGIAGNPAKLFIGDDMLKNYDEASSEVMREKVWEWWESTALQRIEPDTTTILIGTRYFEDDILGRIISASTAGTGLAVEEIVLRAKAEADDPLGRAEGEGLWTDHPLSSGGTWGQAYYDMIETSRSPYVWQSVFQQRPSAPGGNLVNPDWWRFYRPSEIPATFDQEIQSWDLALDSLKKSDSYYCGGVLARKGALVFVRDAFHEHCDINDVIKRIKAWNQAFSKAKTKLVERSLAGPALVSTLRSEVSGMTVWPPKGKQKDSKEGCLNAIIPDIMSGNVLLPLLPDGTRPRWVQELIEEMRVFPRGSHDDYVDMMSQGVAFLLPSARTFKNAEARLLASQPGPPLSPEATHIAGLHAALKKMAQPRIDALKEQMKRGERLIRVPRPATGSGSTRRRRVMC